MKTTNENKKKVIESLLKKKIKGLKEVYGGTACTVRPKPIVLSQCYICTVTPPQNPGGGTTGQA
ncbi:hypothetical protein Q73A0000_07045 [Kaistella flava (ex Peng et al. 2021)]|jgi:hypothetical protein|uniref:Uncharacterized protein n=1 Tax=Kaistella flava (ex Peng et al. 2021) TaxID=2038776 RepID=A0A7M2Y9V8_9FLAO|nr:hypothetical protein [Kaistella flava (ex Peng et al. 2021)]QOW10133.1 hypothetical protein Q73A0000_07045 [Kaistella flava (ex Peng et al. 2021)]